LTHVLELHRKLKEAARQYLVRQAKVYDGDFFMWPVPWYDGEGVLGDQAQRNAHFAAKDDWIKLVWTGDDYSIVPTDEPHAFDPPNWVVADDFEEALKRAVMPILIQDLEHKYVKTFLGRRCRHPSLALTALAELCRCASTRSNTIAKNGGHCGRTSFLRSTNCRSPPTSRRYLSRSARRPRS
jgi:hypothetical protein